MEGYVGQEYVGIDLHRKRSAIVRTDAAGEVLESVQIVNTAEGLQLVTAAAGPCPEVVLEATSGGGSGSLTWRPSVHSSAPRVKRHDSDTAAVCHADRALEGHRRCPAVDGWRDPAVGYSRDNWLLL